MTNWYSMKILRNRIFITINVSMCIDKNNFQIFTMSFELSSHSTKSKGMVATNSQRELIILLSLSNFFRQDFVVNRIKYLLIVFSRLFIVNITHFIYLMTHLSKTFKKSRFSDQLWTHFHTKFLLSKIPIGSQKVNCFHLCFFHYI